MNDNNNQPRTLDLTFFSQIAQTVTELYTEVKRVKASAEFAAMLGKASAAVNTVADAAQSAADDIQDIIVLALQVYEQSQFKGRSLAQVKAPDEITDRNAFIQQAVINVRALESSEPEAA